MKKHYFNCDYLEGAHPRILEKFVETNMQQMIGYGFDPACGSARKKILEACGCPEGEVHFIPGGTQANATVIAALLASYEGVIAADTGHINGHEAGAVEYTGHKVIALPHKDGKLCPEAVRKCLKKYEEDGSREHTVKPGMVYISHPSEYGTLYTLQELTSLNEICREYKIPLYMDGARLGYGLAAGGTDVTLEDIARLCDVFYIGGTKVGALCGEAVVVTRPNLIPYFFSIIKQHGALTAKGRLLGVQFDVLFTDHLYFDIGAHAVRLAEKMKQGFIQKGYEIFIDSPTNQQFVVLENEKMKQLEENVGFEIWEKFDETHTVVRFVTSWATTEEDVDFLLEIL